MADKFRRNKEPRHLRLYFSVMESEAYRHLSGNALKVLLALVRLDNGTRNGNIAFSARRAADDTGLSARTCWAALKELQDKGFIRCTQKGSFSRKVQHASLWRYTWVAWPEGKIGPTRDFEKWRPEGKTRMQKLSSTDAISGERLETTPTMDANSAAEETGKPQKCDVSRTARFATHNYNHRGAKIRACEENWKQPDKSSRPELAELRQAFLAHLSRSEYGEQSRLALKIGCPGGTLSKFKSGSGLPITYVESLRQAM
jgi:DNA-binding Lrp family transcriptional regulator